MAAVDTNLFIPRVLADPKARNWADKQVKVVSKVGAAAAAAFGGRVGAVGARAAGLGSLRPLFWAFNLKDDVSKLSRPTSYGAIALLVKVCFEVTFVTSSALRLANYFYPVKQLAQAAAIIGKPCGYFVATVMAMETGKYLVKSAKGEKISTADKWDWAADSLELIATIGFLRYTSRKAVVICSLLSATSGWCELHKFGLRDDKNPFALVDDNDGF